MALYTREFGLAVGLTVGAAAVGIGHVRVGEAQGSKLGQRSRRCSLLWIGAICWSCAAGSIASRANAKLAGR